VSGSVISWAICKSAPRSRQPRQHPTTQFFTGRMPFLPPNQQRQSTGKSLTTPPHLKYAATLPCNLSLSACSADVSQGSVATMHVLSTKLIYVCAVLRLGMWMRPLLQWRSSMANLSVSAGHDRQLWTNQSAVWRMDRRSHGAQTAMHHIQIPQCKGAHLSATKWVDVLKVTHKGTARSDMACSPPLR